MNKKAWYFKVFRPYVDKKDPGELLLQGLIFVARRMIIFTPNRIKMIALKHRVKPHMHCSIEVLLMQYITNVMIG